MLMKSQEQLMSSLRRNVAVAGANEHITRETSLRYGLTSPAFAFANEMDIWHMNMVRDARKTKNTLKARGAAACWNQLATTRKECLS